ncbi:MAG TPA: fibronectin type III domain-containing protein [Candidatus Limnocylindrales bacterium]|nr:fibronectin type III domain-containing protein [Candidatus Limnocylindrales bacterium]
MQLLNRLFSMGKLFILVGVLFTLGFPDSTLAAPYGSCGYGSYLFNGQCVPSNSSGSSSNSNSSTQGSTTGTPGCSAQAPGSAPNLFQINTVGTNAILYFAPSQHPYTNYYVSFGDGTKDEGYGASFALSQTTGALKYDVYKLKPNTRYTFKVRAGNGCMAGPWSSTLAVKTGANKSKYINKYYPFKQAYVTKSVKTWVNGAYTYIQKIFVR